MMNKSSINKSVSIFGALMLTCLLVETVEAIEVPPNIQTYLQTATVTEFGFPSGTEQQRTEFTTWLTANWSAVLSDIETVAPDERKQKVIVAGAESLPGTNYVSFLSGFLDKYEAGKVKKVVGIEAMSPGGKKYGFLAFNYKHPTVKTLCNRAKALFPSDAALQALMTETLSGEQGKQAGAALAMENRPEPEILPAP
jgi:hypothetical protein